MKKQLYRLFQWVVKGIPVTKISAGITTTIPNQVLADKKILITGGGRGIGYYGSIRFWEIYASEYLRNP